MATSRFKKVLVANRGEIAIRVLRALREMGIATVAVYSEADRDSLHVRIADEAYCVGPAPSRESYLKIDAIVGAARRSRSDAIHPGYGFLSENADFARRCAEQGVVFIGPPPEAMEALGDKVAARKMAQAAGIPIVPGTLEAVRDPEEARKEARRIGFPIMIKAAAGGGGRGMRLIREPGELEGGIRSAMSEALAGFGNDAVFLERAVERPRHVEIQVMADTHGKAVHLFERECSIQRRHQKLVEESPSTALDEKTRRAMGEAAVALVKKAGYVGAGTVEFLLDPERRFYFLEMNTRLQVEHPVTEWVVGVDLVKAQIGVAQGGKLPWAQKDLAQRGWALECRICAEDPERDFAPAPGRVTSVRLPGGLGVRVDGFLYEGYEIPLYYDSLLSKLVVWGADRAEAIDRMRRALREYQIKGVRTNLAFHLWIMDHPKFRSGDLHTGFIEEEFGAGALAGNRRHGEVAVLAAALAAHFEDRERSKELLRSWTRSNRGDGVWRHAGRAEALGRRIAR